VLSANRSDCLYTREGASGTPLCNIFRTDPKILPLKSNFTSWSWFTRFPISLWIIAQLKWLADWSFYIHNLWEVDSYSAGNEFPYFCGTLWFIIVVTLARQLLFFGHLNKAHIFTSYILRSILTQRGREYPYVFIFLVERQVSYKMWIFIHNTREQFQETYILKINL